MAAGQGFGAGAAASDAAGEPLPAAWEGEMCSTAASRLSVAERWQQIVLTRPLLRATTASCDGLKPVDLTPEVQALLRAGAVVAVGVSGGKDSDAAALAVARHLEAIAHTGPRVLVHADLGRVEWTYSLPHCQQLAQRMGWELMVERRAAGDLLTRWQGRWSNSIARYEALECVRLILPWSTPSMRFCTSELKVDVIASALKKRFPGRDIISVSGIRAQESASRSRMPVSKPMAKLQRRGAAGLAWNAILGHSLEDVLREIDHAGMQPHEAYLQHGASRVSCVYCMMGSAEDLQAAAACAANREVYLAMCDLEARSSFAFQGSRWLADVAPHLLPADLVRRIARAKQVALLRQQAEALIPESLRYTHGAWPLAVPSAQEAQALATARRTVCRLLQMKGRYLTGPAVRERYSQLIAAARRLEIEV